RARQAGHIQSYLTSDTTFPIGTGHHSLDDPRIGGHKCSTTGQLVLRAAYQLIHYVSSLVRFSCRSTCALTRAGTASDGTSGRGALIAQKLPQLYVNHTERKRLMCTIRESSLDSIRVAYPSGS